MKKFLIIILLILLILHPKNSYAQQIEPLWEYECIDTMKTSRDKAKEWANSPRLQEHINNQLDSIVELGANCVAIATPYDVEFLPYLTSWVEAARDRNLHIWYRGNFSSWEGWFGYPKGMTIEEHNRRTREFILLNRNLFEDGDIFTPSPEAENGGPFNQVEVDEHEAFRKYLIAEYNTAKSAFSEINKNVQVNWLAMNGGLAKRMFDQSTIDSVGKVVAIDHYVKTPFEMGEFIKYFNEKYGAKVVIGEWGAPIPQINGKMTDDEQASFIRDLLWEMYMHNNMVLGISYWVLYDGSTSLQHANETPRKAFYTVKDYYSPGAINGSVKDSYGDSLAGAEIKINDIKRYQADEQGNYKFSLPKGEYNLTVSHPNAKEQKINVKVNSNQIVLKNIVLSSEDSNIKHWFKGLFSKVEGLVISLL